MKVKTQRKNRVNKNGDKTTVVISTTATHNGVTMVVKLSYPQEGVLGSLSDTVLDLAMQALQDLAKEANAR